MHLHDISMRTRTVKPQIFLPGKSVSGVIHVTLDGGGALNGYASRVLRILGRRGRGGYDRFTVIEPLLA